MNNVAQINESGDGKLGSLGTRGALGDSLTTPGGVTNDANWG